MAPTMLFAAVGLSGLVATLASRQVRVNVAAEGTSTACSANSRLCLCKTNPISSLPLPDGTGIDLGIGTKMTFYITGPALDTLYQPEAEHLSDISAVYGCEEVYLTEKEMLQAVTCYTGDSNKNDTMSDCFVDPKHDKGVAVAMGIPVKFEPKILKCFEAKKPEKIMGYFHVPFSTPGLAAKSLISYCIPKPKTSRTRRVWCEWKPSACAAGKLTKEQLEAECLKTDTEGDRFFGKSRIADNQTCTCGQNSKLEKCIHRLSHDNMMAPPWARRLLGAFESE